ncbi:MAG: hypothetical protein AAF830_13350 [Pseudomonadota bacterium]
MGRFFVNLFAAVSVLATPAWADWKESFRAYERAMQAGATEAAGRHAKEAWTKAKAELPPSDDVAHLAQIYGELTLLTDPRGAEPAFADAVALGEQGFGLQRMSLAESQFGLSAAQALSRSRDDRRSRAAAGAITPLSLDERKRPIWINARIVLAQNLNNQRQFALAAEVASMVADDLFSFSPKPLAGLVTAEALYSAAAIYGRGGEVPGGVARAQRRWVRLAREFPMQTSIDTFDPYLAQVIAWESITRGLATPVLGFQGLFDADPSEVLQRQPVVLDPMPYFLEPTICAARMHWIEQEKKTIRDNTPNNGGVMIGFSFKEDGRVDKARILAEVPAEENGREVLAQVKKWRADPEKLTPECRQGYIAYTIRNIPFPIFGR